VEEVEDEDDVSHATKKKKKKSKKKKKITSLELEKEPSPGAAPPALTIPAQAPPIVPTTPPKRQASGPKSPVSAVRSPSLNTPSSTTLPRMSTASLALSVEPTPAQSARSYLQSEKLDDPKTKIKSRPDHALSFFKPGKGIFAKFAGKDNNTETELEKEGLKPNWFTKLGKRAKGHMKQLLGDKDTKGIKPMKWEHFLKVCIFL
jgi:hypothetical protein